MKVAFSAGESILFVANVLALFLIIFESKVSIPSWLQVVGRMHPLLLHFPIVLVLLTILLYAIAKSLRKSDVMKGVALAGAITSSLTIVMGLFLSHESGYSAPDISLHKWFGVAFGALATFFYYQVALDLIPRAVLVTGPVLVAVVMLTGHFGAVITHGDNFLFEPLGANDKVQVSLDEAIVYEHLVVPVLEQKCYNCHNPAKAKGKLDLTTKQSVQKGGKTGSLIVSGKPQESLLLKRIHLPESDKKHMPPRNKEQLTDTEMEILYYWIKTGASFDTKVNQLAGRDTLKLLAMQQFEGTEKVYDFAAADEDIIEKLNNEYRVIFPLAAESPALFVNIYNASQYSSKQLEELKPIKKQIVSLDLNKMPLKDTDLEIVGTFENLEKLNLNGTPVTGASLKPLSKLKKLKSLAISSTNISASDLSTLSDMPQLLNVFAWNTPITAEDQKKLVSKNAGVMIETGFKPDQTKVLRLTAPRIDNETRIYSTPFSISFSHPVKEVTFRYTLDGSEPDSVTGTVYKEPIAVTAPITNIKVRAFKPGWYGSEMMRGTFYKTTFRPDSVRLLSAPNKKYFPTGGGMILMDLEAGDYNYASYGGWVGYRENPMKLEVEFGKPVELQEVILSTRFDIGAYVFPPRKVEVWAGDDLSSLKLLGSFSPAQPKAYDTPGSPGISCKFPTTSCRYLRIIAEPVPKLPPWHSGKGDKAWVMVDEILFN